MIKAPDTAGGSMSTVLVIDDNPANIGVVAQGLERRGHRVLVAQDGEEGLERAAIARPDLILLDVMMPGIDGFETCARLKADAATRAIPVIFMTALAEMGDKLAAFAAGAVDYVTKPLQMEEVLARVETQLQLRAMQKRLEAQNAELAMHRDNLERLVADRTAELEASNRQLRAEVAERRRAQEELAAREREFRTLAENAPDNIARHDLHGRYLYLNPRLETTLRLEASSWIGRAPVELFPASQDVAAYQARMQGVLESGRPAEFEATLPDMGEGARYHNIRMVAERDERGRVVGVLAIGRDITERKEYERRLLASEQALRASERQFRTLAENLPDNVVRYDRSGTVIYANAKMQAQLALSPGANPGDTLPKAEDRARYRNALARVIETGAPEQVEVRAVTADGVWLTHQVSFVAERRTDGEVRGALAIGRDITALKEAERRLEESHAQLRELARHRETAREEERKHIARELHDDLGQHLTALRLNTSALSLEFGGDHPALQERLDQILAIVDNTKRVVRGLSQRLRPAALDMGIDAALEWLVEEFSERTGIACRLALGEGRLDLGDTGAMVAFRVVQESLTNVARHAEAGGAEVSLAWRDGCFILAVRDDGKGFEPSRRRSGSFGLVGMRERLLAVGGRLEIISEPGSGTSVVAYLPAQSGETTSD